MRSLVRILSLSTGHRRNFGVITSTVILLMSATGHYRVAMAGLTAVGSKMTGKTSRLLKPRATAFMPCQTLVGTKLPTSPAVSRCLLSGTTFPFGNSSLGQQRLVCLIQRFASQPVANQFTASGRWGSRSQFNAGVR